MKRISIVFVLFVFQQYCFGQSQTMDSLKAIFKNAQEDTAKLKAYMALCKAAERKDKLLYAGPAWKLVDELFIKEKQKDVRDNLINAERELPDLVISFYSNNDSTDWNKAMPYLINHLQAIEKTGDKKRTANFLLTVASISLDQRKDSAHFRTYITKSIDLSKEIKDSALIIDSYGYMCAFYKSAGNFASALEAAQSSMEVCRQLHYDRGIARSHRMLAFLYGDYGEDELALSNYEAALDIANKIKDDREKYNTLIPLGGFYSMRNNTGKALAYFNMILELCKNSADLLPELAEVYRMTGEIYMNNKDYKNAMGNFEKSLTQSRQVKNNSQIMTTMLNIGDMYNSQGNFEKALYYHTRVIGLADSTGGLNGLRGYLKHLLAQDYFGLKKYNDAKKLNDFALTSFKKLWFDVKTTSQMELLASQIDSAKGDGFGAFTHYKEYVSLTDKIRGDEIKKSAQKEKFKEEVEKQNTEQEKKDAIAKRTRNLQYMAIGAFLLLGIFLAYGYIQKNNAKKQIEIAYAELKSTQSQLIQSEKMASLGELTAGIAHEIQNPLNFVNNFSDVNKELLTEMNEEISKGNYDEVKTIAKDVIDNEEKINHHGKRADAIVKGMLQHSQSSSGKKEPSDINKLADEYLRLAYHGIRAKDKSFNATLKTDFDESIGNINIIPQDIGRVILNLITNAFYIVAEKKKEVASSEKSSVENLTSLYEPTVSVSTRKTGDKVLIAITDNGNGIPKNIIDKIFQPFFTTKPTGQGTGLGLSLSYDIVKAHGGELKVETKEGEGSTFIIQLPAKDI